jgi:hypothetical protein
MPIEPEDENITNDRQPYIIERIVYRKQLRDRLVAQ